MSYGAPHQYYYMPSPSGPQVFYASPRGHRHGVSADYTYTTRPNPSPRYASTGQYATRTGQPFPGARYEYVSADYRTPGGHFQSQPKSKPSTRPRGHSESFRPSHGDSEDDEWVLHEGRRYFVPGARRTREATGRFDTHGRGTDRYYYQEEAYDRHFRSAESRPRPVSPSPRPRRASASTPKRPSSSGKRPSSSHKKAAEPPKTRAVTEKDIKRAGIPRGFSLKNWDPDEEPLFLLGSVFDCNSLGKWIYDWTVYRHQAGTPISDMAGELWLLLIALAGKVKRAEECMPRIRSRENREMVDDFISGGERLSDKLQKLLKACEAPMLKADKKRSGKEGVRLGNDAGVKFVEHVFGRDHQLQYTEKLMAAIRLWSMRFDANCEEVLRRPTK